jgi:hypothetical protein
MGNVFRCCHDPHVVKYAQNIGQLKGGWRIWEQLQRLKATDCN